MILLIDNYDSFSYNLVQALGGICPDIKVCRNDEITVEEIEKQKPTHLVLSPGPGYPKKAGICEEAVKMLRGRLPILGVCLGHQAICEVYGAQITHAVRLMHGKKSNIRLLKKDPLFKELPDRIDAARYHSLIAKRDTVPENLMVLAEDLEGEIMAVRDKNFPVYGVQFHPESILTPLGEKILENFVNIG